MVDYKQLDTRWEQRFSNYCKALEKLSKAVEIIKPQIDIPLSYINDVDELQREGLIQRFEYTHELAWNVMSDYARYQGYQEIKGSRDAIRYALKAGLINDAVWMETIRDRNRTTHTYNEETALEVLTDIVKKYFPLFVDFEQKMDKIRMELNQ